MEFPRDERFDDLHDPEDRGDEEEVDPESDPDPEWEPACMACSRPIDDDFYLVGDAPICPECRDASLAGLVGGSRVKRFLKALVLGSLAGAVGAGAYYAILNATGTHFGLMAIVVGLMVGTAVRKGSEGRGGWFYQLLAVFLTYTAIVTTYVPQILKEFNKIAGARAAANPAEVQKIKADIAKATPLTRVGKLVAALVVIGALVMVIAYVTPILVAIHGGGFFLVIVSFGLWGAWKLNRRAIIPFQGPYRLDDDADFEPEPSG